MARVKGAMMTRKRRNKIMKLAKGYWGSKSKHFRVANQAVMKSLSYAYTGRKLKKRDFRSLWITRISAACKMNGMNYSTFMHGLKTAGVEINRKMLAELAVSDAAAFTQLTEIAKKAYLVFETIKRTADGIPKSFFASWLRFRAAEVGAAMCLVGVDVGPGEVLVYQIDVAKPVEEIPGQGQLYRPDIGQVVPLALVKEIDFPSGQGRQSVPGGVPL